MKIFVGRWDLIPDSTPHYAISAWSRAEVVAELAREIDEYAKSHDVEDNNMGAYDAQEFEDTFNGKTSDHINTKDYWIRIFEED